jgi:hypothetical protein
MDVHVPTVLKVIKLFIKRTCFFFASRGKSRIRIKLNGTGPRIRIRSTGHLNIDFG